MFFVVFMALFVIFWISSSEIFQIFTAYCIQNDTNFKLKKVGFVKDIFLVV